MEEDFAGWLRRRGVPEAHLETYLRVASHLERLPGASSPVGPQDLELAIRQQEAAGASPGTLANLRRIGEALIEFHTSRAATAAPTAPPVDPPVRASTTVVCELHGLRYDPARHDGCLRCRKEKDMEKGRPRTEPAAAASAPSPGTAGLFAARAWQLIVQTIKPSGLFLAVFAAVQIGACIWVGYGLLQRVPGVPPLLFMLMGHVFAAPPMAFFAVADLPDNRGVLATSGRYAALMIAWGVPWSLAAERLGLLYLLALPLIPVSWVIAIQAESLAEGFRPETWRAVLRRWPELLVLLALAPAGVALFSLIYGPLGVLVAFKLWPQALPLLLVAGPVVAHAAFLVLVTRMAGAFVTVGGSGTGDARPAPPPRVEGSPRRPLLLVGGAAVLLLGLGIVWLKRRPVVGETPANLRQPTESIDGRRFLPLTPGNRWVYHHELALGDGEPDRETRELVVERMPASDAWVFIDEPGRGLLTRHPMQYASRPEGVITASGFFGAAKTQFDPPFVDLPSQIAPGGEWTWRGTSRGQPMEIDSRLVGLETVKIPAGEFECIRVERRMPQVPAALTVHWYADGVGLVRMLGERPAAGLVPHSRMSFELVSTTVGGLAPPPVTLEPRPPVAKAPPAPSPTDAGAQESDVERRERLERLERQQAEYRRRAAKEASEARARERALPRSFDQGQPTPVER